MFTKGPKLNVGMPKLGAKMSAPVDLAKRAMNKPSAGKVKMPKKLGKVPIKMRGMGGPPILS